MQIVFGHRNDVRADYNEIISNSVLPVHGATSSSIDRVMSYVRANEFGSCARAYVRANIEARRTCCAHGQHAERFPVRVPSKYCYMPLRLGDHEKPGCYHRSRVRRDVIFIRIVYNYS